MNRIIVLGILITLINSCGLKDDYRPISHKEFLKTHTYNVGQRTLEIEDTARERPLKTEIWYPTRDTSKVNITLEYPFKLPPTAKDADFLNRKFPLILLSHGTGGNRISQMWLAGELASDGYIVAAVDHWGNTLDNKIPENFVKIWDRPLDISFVIDELIEHPKIGSQIDTSRIGMAGFSLGGYTAIALAGGELDYDLLKEFSMTKEGKSEFDVPELGDVSKLISPEIIERGNKDFVNLKDNRISAFVAMAPALGQGFENTEQFANIDKPVLIIGAENDERAPIKTNAKQYHRLIKNSQYVEIEGKVGHYIFMNRAKKGLQREAPLIFKDDKSIDREKLHRKISEIVITFFDKNLKEKAPDNIYKK